MQNGNLAPGFDLVEPFTIETPVIAQPNELVCNNTTTQKVTLSNIVNPRPFLGGAGENIDDWLNLYKMISDANGWADDVEKLKRLPLYLESAARQWFLNYKREQGSDIKWNKTQAEMLKVFNPANKQACLFDKLRRKMVLGEDFQNYYYEKLNICDKYNDNMSDQEKTNILISGLTPYLLEKAYCLKPQTPQELFEHLKLFSESSNLASQASNESVNVMNAISQVNNEIENLSNRFDRNMRVGRQRFRGSFRGRGGFRGGNFRSGNFRGRNFQGGNFQRNYQRENFENRGRSKTPPRQIRCYSCGKIGHMQRDCYSRDSRSRSRSAETKPKSVRFQKN